MSEEQSKFWSELFAMTGSGKSLIVSDFIFLALAKKGKSVKKHE